MRWRMSPSSTPPGFTPLVVGAPHATFGPGSVVVSQDGGFHSPRVWGTSLQRTAVAEVDGQYLLQGQFQSPHSRGTSADADYLEEHPELPYAFQSPHSRGTSADIGHAYNSHFRA